MEKLDELGDRLVALASPELNEYYAANPEFVHPLEGLPFMSTFSAAATVVAYLSFVLFGSLFMKVVMGGKPIRALDTLKFWYNPAQSWLSAWLMIEATRQAYINGLAVVGNAFQPERRSIALVLYVFYISKVFDFMDTVFIVLGAKWKQLSVLHVYHHASIFVTYWWICRSAWDGDIYLTITLNGAVHAVMYFYYALTSYRLRDTVPGVVGPLTAAKGGPVANSDPKTTDERALVTAAAVYSPWWKRYITYMQLAQFTLMNAQGIYLIFFFEHKKGDIAYPRNVTIFYVFYIQSLFWLFRNFASKNYGTKKSSKSKKRQ